MNKNVHNNKAMKGNYRMYRKIKRWWIFSSNKVVFMDRVYDYVLASSVEILVFSLKHCSISTEQHNILA